MESTRQSRLLHALASDRNVAADHALENRKRPKNKSAPLAGHSAHSVEDITEIIDRETGLRELEGILERISADAGDLVESRSAELDVQARHESHYWGCP
jgi:hypothetical protein